MFLTITRRQLWGGVLILFAVVLLIAGFSLIPRLLPASHVDGPAGAVSPGAASSGGVRKIVIDAGHGGEDGGAVSKDGVMEKNINLSIAMQLSELLKAEGYEVTLTRTEDVSLHEEGTASVKGRKASDLKQRLKIMQEHPDAMFVSVHLNQFPDSSIWGAQVFYSPNNEESKALAESLQGSLKELQPDNKRVCKEADRNIYLLKKAECPAVIVECGFLSNPDEAAKLQSEDYQRQMAQTIFNGITTYYQQDVQNQTESE